MRGLRGWSLAVERGDMDGAGEEGVMGRSLSQGTSLLREGQDRVAANLPSEMLPGHCLSCLCPLLWEQCQKTRPGKW